MNPVALQIANGNSFFIGMGMVAVALALRLWLKGRISALALRITYIAGIVFVFFSATPISSWVYGLWFSLCVAAALVTFNVRSSLRHKVVAVGAAVIFCLIMSSLEVPYHRSPRIVVPPNKSLFVVGDSISAGISNREKPWPDVLSELSHLKVTNLAGPGATVETALNQSADLTESNSLVFVEIGGNDLLGHTDSKTFRVQLDELLGRLEEGNNQVVMFELPLFPFCNSFGAAQRDLAKKYNVTLIPKRYLTDVFALKDGTLDGLHLSQKGQEALANSIYSLIKTK
jgi:lysophospholipase L1-like esterase